MLILALDTTTRAGSVAVTDDETVLAVVQGDASRTHGERLPAEIERALAMAGVAPTQLALLAVASGPGAFTGMRIGLAAIQGMAMVLNTPVIGVSALDALAWEAWAVRRRDERHVIAWMDALRGEVFAAYYSESSIPGDERREDGGSADIIGATLLAPHPAGSEAGTGDWPRSERPDPIVGPPHAVLSAIDGSLAGVLCVGDGAVRYRTELDTHFRGGCRVIDTPVSLAPAVARIGQRRAARGHAGPPHALQPLYVRRPDAELERQRRRES